MLENHFISEDNEMSISKTNPAEEIEPVRYRHRKIHVREKPHKCPFCEK